MPQHRQLAAIMFTDIEGYTATMQRDEEQALFLKDRHRDILQQKHNEFNGRIIQYYGDGTLSIFHSAVEAVECALQMQQQFCQTPGVPVRIGLHLGDIIINDNHVFGDGVNLASRIESLSIPGAVLISDKIKDEIRNHPEFAYDLAADAKVTASSYRGKSQTYSPAMLNDGNKNTYWATDDNVEKASIEIDLKKNAKVKYVVLEEFIRLGQRISRFNIEKWENGRWIKVADATTIGHKRILKLDNVQTEKIRVNILSSKACPLISGISVY